jgi:hypothetical protein
LKPLVGPRLGAAQRRKGENAMVDPSWFYITFGVIVVLVAGLMWWAGAFKKK